MGTTSQKLTYLSETKSQLKDMINYGLDTGEKITSETTFRNYVKSLFDAFIKTMTYPDVLYNNLPKVTGTGTSITLNGTAEAPMRNILSPSEIEQRNLPNDYTQVDYIESTGTQYIDTGVKLSSNHGFDIKFLTNNTLGTSGYGCILGGRDGSSVKDYQLTTYIVSSGFQGTLRLGYGSGDGIANANITLNTIQQCSLKNKTFTSCNGTVTQLISNAEQSNYNCYLFGLNNGPSGYAQSGNGCRIYYCKFYDGNNLIRNFIPCYRNSDNEIGMYDLVNDVFYTNQGTGTFAKGNDVTPSPENPQQIHTVSGDNSVKVGNKNLLSIDKLVVGRTYEYYKFKELDDSSYYTLSIKLKDGGIQKNMYIGFGDGITPPVAHYSWLLNNGNINIGTLQTDGFRSITNLVSGFYCNYIIVYKGSGNTLQDLFDNYDIQLVKGNTYLSYQPPQEQTYTISLGDLEYCKIGDYEDEFYKATESDTGLTAGKWYLKKNIGKIVLDGSESGWDMGTGTNVFMNTNIFNNTYLVQNAYSNYFKNIVNENITGTGTANNNLQNNEFSFRWGTKDRIYIKTDIVSTIADFKTWLSTHNTIVYYVLATPTYTLLSDTLQTQLDNIHKAISYQDQTNITQTNDDLPFVIKMSAIRDLSGIFELIQG